LKKVRQVCTATRYGLNGLGIEFR